VINSDTPLWVSMVALTGRSAKYSSYPILEECLETKDKLLNKTSIESCVEIESRL